MAALRKIYRAVLWKILKKTFALWERLGFHVVPNHYYFPVPDTRLLNNGLWSSHGDLSAINMNVEGQGRLLSEFLTFKNEYGNFPRAKTGLAYQYYLNNGSFESVDAEVLYCMIRHFKPKKFFEIGSANSTYLAAQAILKNSQSGGGQACEMTVCDPYANKVIKRGFPGLSRLLERRVQDLPVSEFGGLEENDILFIDSSHILSIDSDVRYEFSRILPNLKRGVIVHFHDIFLPAEYPREWIMKERYFYNEQYLLQAFLAFNDNFQVLWAGSFMHLNHPDKLESAFTSYDKQKDWPGSFWIRKTK